jgi:hypothetical protein
VLTATENGENGNFSIALEYKSHSQYSDWWGGCGVDSPGSGQGPLVGSHECGDEPLGFGTTVLVS